MSWRNILDKNEIVLNTIIFFNVTNECFETRGILLHGSPATGKSLIARSVCDMLQVTSKIVRGPEIFSCMLAESEKKIRDLFEDARCDQKNFGASSKLHVIVFDEIDAVCKNRTQ